MNAGPDLFIAHADAQAINRMLIESERRASEDSSTELATKLFDAQVLDPRALPPGTVRLNCAVDYDELPAGPRRRVVLVSPQQADPREGRISVFSPIGRALLGNVVGRTISVLLPTGQPLTLRIADVLAEQTADVD